MVVRPDPARQKFYGSSRKFMGLHMEEHFLQNDNSDEVFPFYVAA